MPGSSVQSAGNLNSVFGSLQCETVQQIINVAATAEALAVTALGGALQAAQGNSPTLALSADQIKFVAAAQYEEYLHYSYLTTAGAQALTLTFTLPDPKIISDVPTFLNTVIGLEEAFIAAYLTAAQEFAIQGKRDLVHVALQIGGDEAEHRAYARYFAITGGILSGVPNNLAFEQGMFTRVGQAADTLTKLGWIGGSGPQITFPGPVSNPSSVTNTSP